MSKRHSLRAALAGLVGISYVGCGGAINRSDDVAAGSPARAEGPGATSPLPEAPPTKCLAAGRATGVKGQVSLVEREAIDWVGVDPWHVYFTAGTVIARVSKAGGAIEALYESPSLLGYGKELALLPTSINFSTDAGLVRMAKSGGLAVPFPQAFKYGVSSIAADSKAVVALAPDIGLIRCDEGKPCTTEGLRPSKRLVMDAEWIYFRRRTSGQDVSLVRVPRKEASRPNTYDVLMADVGLEGFIAMDDARIYITRREPGTGTFTLASISKVPGSPVAILLEDAGVIANMIVDDYWIYWPGHTDLLALPKNGSSRTPVVIGSPSGESTPATDGTCVYWSVHSDWIYAAPVPRRP